MSGPGYPTPTSPPLPTRSRRLPVAIGVAVVALVVVALAVVLVVVGSDDGGTGTARSDASTAPGQDPPSGAESDAETDADPTPAAGPAADVVASATQFIEVFNTFGPDDLADDGTLAGYEESVDALITPDLAGTLDDAVGVAETLAGTGGSSKATVVAVGVQSLGDDSATALVAATTEKSDGRLAPSTASTRNLVGLTLVDGAWLVDDLQIVAAQPGPLEIVGAQDGAAEAGEAALTALPQILGYDYRTVEKDFAAARDLLSESYRAEFDQLTDLVVEESRKDQVVVTLTPLQVGLASYDDTSAEILVFADQGVARTAGPGQTQVAVVLAMVLVDGRWLVDGLGV